MQWRGVLAQAVAALCLVAAPARPQAVAPRRFGTTDTARQRVSAPVAGLLSAAVPGAGEYALGLERWVPQIALEAFAWWQYRAHRQEARSFERQYRHLACQVARRIVAGECRDSSDFEYYEMMGKSVWPSCSSCRPTSGSYDTDLARAGVQPEADVTTFNGSIWARAQALYASPDAALRYYETHAIPPGYLWDWGENALEQTVYDELIHRGDAAFRSSSRFLGFILANHVTSAVDAYIAGRLRELGRAPRVEVRTGFEQAGGEVRWRAGVRIGVGRR